MTQMQSRTITSRLRDIDCGRGLAIGLVVVGHIVRQPPEGGEWYFTLSGPIYLFHMPFFMYLAGFIFGYRFEPIHNVHGALGFLQTRGSRLLIPFFAIGVLIVLAKTIFADIFSIERVPESIEIGLRNLFVDTRKSPAQLVWFAFCLFVYEMLAYVISRSGRHWCLFLIVTGLAVHFYNPSDILYFHLLTEFLIYFAIGLFCGKNAQTWFSIVDRYWAVLVPIFLLALSLPAAGIDYRYAKLVCGLLSIPALHGLMRQSWMQQPWLEALGRLSYPVYLFNTLAVGATRALLLIVVSWNATNFLWMFPVLIVAGISLPIVLRRMVLRHIPFVERITR